MDSDAITGLAEMRHIEQATSPGTWRAEKNYDLQYEPGYSIYLAPADGGVFGADGEVGWACRKEDAAFAAASHAFVPKAITALEEVLRLHRPFGVYNDCNCPDLTTPEHILVEEIGLTCNRILDICRACCMSGGYQTEECVNNHQHEPHSDYCLSGTFRAIEEAFR